MKQLMKWNRKKRHKLKVFYRLQQRDGSVSISEMADELEEIRATTYLWKTYCMDNGIIELSVAGRYVITDFGKTLIGVENE